jgi:putative methyltransferase (TIGR04325 family)
MDLTKALHDAVDGLLQLPGLRQWRSRKYDRRFESADNVNLFRGVYASAAQASAAIPSTKPAGYDHDGPAAMYAERTRQIYPSDYPILFWLQKLLSDTCNRVFDIGGHIGVGYYAYQKYLNYPASLRWRVSDVPAVAERGRQLALKSDRSGKLSFTSDLTEAADFDIVFASGSIQYLPSTLAELLRNAPTKPKHVLINLLPLHPTETYYTVQNIGVAFCAYRIESLPQFIAAMRAAGYHLHDRWENLEKRCEIPFSAPGYSLDRYYGFYFELE